MKLIDIVLLTVLIFLGYVGYKEFQQVCIRNVKLNRVQWVLLPSEEPKDVQIGLRNDGVVVWRKKP